MATNLMIYLLICFNFAGKSLVIVDIKILYTSFGIRRRGEGGEECE
ncbi:MULTISPECIES: hypothetical protein [Butyricimonas]|uniref:Uncharacterized protein n=1 Tax=Butyricimonas hominis TaxID=2763032 RepID=A0ABR7D4K4_9BACT|nr:MULTISPECIES: hypothetical protein [Butyricimonas]MBC5622450.1 hypothetical protein [Butyricimonas hominis]